MMNEAYLPEEDFGDLELQSLDSQETQRRRAPPERVVLTIPAEWLDLKHPLPTDKEFHQWITQQLRLRAQRTNFGDDRSCASDDSHGWGIGGAIREVSSTLLAGIVPRKGPLDMETMTRKLLEEDCFPDQTNDVVGMELSVWS